MFLDVRINPAQEAELRKLLAGMPDRIPVAMRDAINRTGRTGATRIRRRVAGVIGIGVRTLGKRVKWLPASLSRLSGKIRLYDFNVPAIAARRAPTPGGTYPLGKIGDPVALPAAPFKQKMLSGKVAWWVRIGPKRPPERGRYAGKKDRHGNPILRQPIKQIYLPGPRKVFETAPALAAQELAALGDVLEKNLASQADRFLAGKTTG